MIRVGAVGLYRPYTTHMVNLTNGVKCSLFQQGALAAQDTTVTRIQSTHCEQKRWTPVLDTLGAEFFAALVRTENQVIFHDMSERRNRYTRALWQGVPWIIYATTRTWYPEHDFGPGLVLNRKGRVQNVGSYWDEMYRSLPRHTVTRLDYYGKVLAPKSPRYLPVIRIANCHTHETARVPLYIYG